jgi:hypothetical protein
MNYIKLATLEYPLHQGDIRLEHPEIGEEFVCPDTYALVEYVEAPDCKPETQIAYQLTPVQTNGTWRAVWAVRDMTADEIEIRRLHIEDMQKRFGNHYNTDAPGSAPHTIG